MKQVKIISITEMHHICKTEAGVLPYQNSLVFTMLGHQLETALRLGATVEGTLAQSQRHYVLSKRILICIFALNNMDGHIS